MNPSESLLSNVVALMIIHMVVEDTLSRVVIVNCSLPVTNLNIRNNIWCFKKKKEKRILK